MKLKQAHAEAVQLFSADGGTKARDSARSATERLDMPRDNTRPSMRPAHYQSAHYQSAHYQSAHYQSKEYNDEGEESQDGNHSDSPHATSRKQRVTIPKRDSQHDSQQSSLTDKAVSQTSDEYEGGMRLMHDVNKDRLSSSKTGIHENWTPGFTSPVSDSGSESTTKAFPTWFTAAGAVLLWYLTSMTLTGLNKWLFDYLDFTYPFLVTLIHFTLISLSLHIVFLYCSRYSASFTLPHFSKQHYMKWIVPIAFFGTSEIALSNLVYSMVSISVITVVKSSLVLVTYAVSVCLGLERFSFRLLGITVFISGSISCAVSGLEIKSVYGLVILCIAVVFAAFRWVVVHHQLQRQHLNPLQLILLTQPLSCLFLAGPATVVDLRRLIAVESVSPDMQRLMASLALICCTVVLAFLVVFAEYNLVSVTSSVSLTVAGVGKEIATIVMSLICFNEHISFLSVIGITCSIVGIICYAITRVNEAKEFERVLQRSPSDGAVSIASIEMKNKAMIEKPFRQSSGVPYDRIEIKIDGSDDDSSVED